MRDTVHLAFGLALMASLSPKIGAGAQVLRKQLDQRGNYVWIGNTLAQECGSVATAPIVGTIGNCGTNTADLAPDVFWRSDSPADGQGTADVSVTAASARSTAVLNLPAGAMVTYARFYWGAEISTTTADSSIVVDRAGGFASATVAADAAWSVAVPNESNAYWYQSTADATSLVAANGSGAYRVSGVDSIELANLQSDHPFAAWSLVVFYELSSEPKRNLTLFDGFELVNPGSPAVGTLAGFVIPYPGHDRLLGVLAYGAGAGSFGDTLRVDNSDLCGRGDFFDSSRMRYNGPLTTQGDLPQLDGAPESMSGFDLDFCDHGLSVGQTSMKVEARSAADPYLVGAYALGITYTPGFSTSTLAFADMNGGAVLFSDVLEFTVVARYTGDGGTNAYMTVAMPNGLVYVPGSMRITEGVNAGPQTDESDQDPGRYVRGRVEMMLGVGAMANMGGAVQPGDTTIFKFRARIDTLGPTSINIQGVANVDFGQYPTGNGTTEGAPTSIKIDECESHQQCVAPRAICFTTSNPNVCVACVNDADCGDVTSGRVCVVLSQTCVDGCRVSSGNGCPVGQTCVPTSGETGQCRLSDGGIDPRDATFDAPTDADASKDGASLDAEDAGAGDASSGDDAPFTDVTSDGDGESSPRDRSGEESDGATRSDSGGVSDDVARDAVFDGSSPPDASSSPPSDADRGCGCSVGDPHAPGWPSALAALVATAAGLRGRRQISRFRSFSRVRPPAPRPHPGT